MNSPHPTDFVMVRFCTVPYFSMRRGHVDVRHWLNQRKIQYTISKQRLYFQNPPEWVRYEIITRDLCEHLAVVATEVKRRLSAIRWTQMSKIRQPLTVKELELLKEFNIEVIL